MTEMTITTDFSGETWRADVCDRGGERATAPRRHVDDRYRGLLGEAAWNRLPYAIQRRFSKRSRAGTTTIYRGHLEHTGLTTTGWLVAQALRLIGAPLPFDAGTFAPGVVPATVVVEEMAGNRGQVWTRICSRGGRFPQVITSAKRFTGGTGLEEHLGRGIVMRLSLGEEAGALVFRSAGYHVRFGRFRIALPALLAPGHCEIVHRVAPGGRSAGDAFTFALTLTHPLFGRLVHQVAWFTDDPVAATTADHVATPAKE